MKVYCCGVHIRKSIATVHRWMGVCLCVPFLIWFVSGLVLMYCDYPEVSEASRLDNLPLLDTGKIRVAPEEAGAHAGMSNPTEVRISTLLSHPIYRFRSRDRIAVVYADSGEIFHGLREADARQVGAAWVHLRPEDAILESRQIHEDDQWTVQQRYQVYRPLWKFSWPTGEVTYVSDVTGEVVQYTTRPSRLGAYFGAIPHWIYITQLRRNAAAWSRIVILISGAGTVATLLGLITGLWACAPLKRYRIRGRLSHIPYSGQLRWHTILGLTFGFVTFTWILSGMFSMDPIRWPTNPIEDTIEQSLVGANWNGKDFANGLTGALTGAQRHLPAREVMLTYFAGQPIFLAINIPSATSILFAKGDSRELLDYQKVRSTVAFAARPYSIVDERLVTRYEPYYADRKNELRLPTLYLKFDDPQESIVYIDLHTGRVAASYSRWERMDHWLYTGLHDFEIPWLYRHRPLWDVVVIVCLCGGGWLSITGIIIAWRTIRRQGSRKAADLTTNASR